MLYISCVPVVLFVIGIIIYKRLPSYSLEELKENAHNNDSKFTKNFNDYKSWMGGIGFVTVILVLAVGVAPLFFQNQIFSLFTKIAGVTDFAIQKDIGIGGYVVFLFTLIALIPFAIKLMCRFVSRNTKFDLDQFTTLYARDPLKLTDTGTLVLRSLMYRFLPIWLRPNPANNPINKKRDRTFPEKFETYNMEKVASTSLKKQIFSASVIILIGGLGSICLFNNYLVFANNYIGVSIPWSRQLNKISWTEIKNLDLVHYETAGSHGRTVMTYDYAVYRKDGTILLENTWPVSAPDSIGAQNYFKLKALFAANGIPVTE